VEPWFDCQQRKQISLFSKRPRTALGATRFHRWQGGQGVKFSTKLYLVPRLRMSGDTPPLPHTRSWRAETKLYLLKDKVSDFFCCNAPTTCVNYKRTAVVFSVLYPVHQYNTYIHTDIHTHTHTYIHTYTHIHTEQCRDGASVSRHAVTMSSALRPAAC